MQQPFPSKPSSLRRPRTPQDAYNAPNGLNGTMPLSIGRPQARPMTPSGSSSTGSGPRIISPARPSRSDLRPRNASQYSNTSSRTIDRDSYASFDNASSSTFIPPSRDQNGHSEDTLPANQQVKMNAALSAFQSAGARKRTMTNGSSERERERERQVQDEMRRQKQIQERVPGRKPIRSRTLGDIDAVLDRIADDWAFVAEPDFNPVDLALQLLDSSTTGKDLDSFRRTRDKLSRALKGSADKHYQAFAAALPHHASLLSHLTETQSQVVDARTALQEAKDALGSKRSDLVQLWARGQTIDEMVQLLDEIEHLKSIPDVLESLMSEKRLLQAAILLVRSKKTIDKPEMSDIGAVSDMRSYLAGQENALRDILIDELHAHIFLKSFWCESRWAPYTPNQEALPTSEYDNGASSSSNRSPSLTSSVCPPRLRRFLDDLVTRPNDSPSDLKETDIKPSTATRSFSIASITSLVSNSGRDKSQSPESDSFGYLETLLESLAVLGKLGSALDAVCQRLAGEIYALVNSTIDEVYERAEMSRRMSIYAKGVQPRPSSVYVFVGDSSPAEAASVFVDPMHLRLAALQSTEKQTDYEILRDLFWTLYSKLDAVTQSLRVVYEVSNRIGSRRDFKDSSGAKPGSLFPLADMWLPIQSEVRTLLNDYLTDEERSSTGGRNPISSINEVLREAKFSRDRAKQVFRFADTDVKTSGKALRDHETELNTILRETVPGLVQGAADSAVQTTLSGLGTDERLMGVGHHRLLIPPDAFHVSVLFQPTLAFLDRVAEVLPTGLESTRASTELLDDFVLNVYLPQLEEKSSELFHHIVTGHESFQSDPASVKLCPEPLLKAFTQLMALINSLCAMLRTTPFHRENYSRLILSVIIRFYQRCSDKFYAIVSHQATGSPESLLLVSSKWAQKPEISTCLSQLLQANDKEASRRLCEQESQVEMGILGEHTIPKEQLIGSMHDISFLVCLYRSISWLIELLTALRNSSRVEDPQSPDAINSPSLPLLLKPSVNEQLQLPLSREMAMRFDALLKTYEQLAEMVIFAVRLDMRCRTIHYLHSAIRFGNYKIDQEDAEPDPHIIDLNNDLGKADEIMLSALPVREQSFVFEGLETVMEDLLISNSRYIRAANACGIKKLLRNILALRQSIKTMSSWSPNSEFTRAREFYGLFAKGPQGLLDGIRQERKYAFDEYEAMVNLQCGVDQSAVQSGAVIQAADKKYSNYIIELRGLELEQGEGAS